METVMASQKNGEGGAQAAPGAKTATIKPRDARQERMGQAFSQVIAVLMRDPSFRQLRLADLEWLVIPPLMSGQFKLAKAPVQQVAATKQPAGKAPDGGMLVPVAVALWARVSAQIDKTLSETLDKEVRLRPNEWASGDHLWLMAVAGDPRAIPRFVEQLGKSEFKGQQVKMRLRGPDGKVTISTVGVPA